jgi:hypothetical protein
MGHVVVLLQHVLPDHGGRELDDEQEDIDRGGLGYVVLGLKGDLQGLEDALKAVVIQNIFFSVTNAKSL